MFLISSKSLFHKILILNPKEDIAYVVNDF